MMKTVISADTHWCRIYMSGPIDIAKHVIRAECMKEGLCVTIDPTTFLYTGGEEQGFVVGLLNYPRFPATANAIDERARKLAETLLDELHQHSTLVTSPLGTTWITKRAQT